MSDIGLEIWDATRTKKVNATIPCDVAIERIVVVLVDKLSLPKISPTGDFMSYKLRHRQTGTQLLDDKSLEEQQVKDGDVLEILPEITAGRH